MVFIWIRLTMQVLHLTTVQCPFKATRWQHCTRYSDYAFVLYGSSSHLKSSVRGYQEEVTQMCCTESDKFKTIYCSLLFVTGSINDLSMFETDFIFKTVFLYIISVVAEYFLARLKAALLITLFFYVGIKDTTSYWYLVYTLKWLTSIVVFFYVD